MTDVMQLTAPVQRWIARQRSHVPAQRDARPDDLPAGIRLQRRRDQQLAACARLLGMVQSESHYPPSRPASLRDWLAEPTLYASWIAERQGEVLGHVSVGPVGETAVSRMRWREVTGREPSELAGVSRLFVRPRVRGQGIAKALLAMAVEEAHARGLTPVAELVSSSREGVLLFEEQGWRLVGRSASGRRGEDLTSYLYLLPTAVPARR